ncbi:MAG: hypothetical protein QXQ33_00610 [Nitrososphaerota archaeon]
MASLQEILTHVGFNASPAPEYFEKAIKKEFVRKKVKFKRHDFVFRKSNPDAVDIIDLILYAYNERYQFTWMTWGEMGAGKSTLMGWLLYAIYGDWDKVLKYMVYGVKNFEEIITQLRESGKRLPLLVIDDAALQLFNRNFNETEQRRFMQMYQVIREFCSTVVYCAPYAEEIDTSIRRKTNGVITVIAKPEKEFILNRYLPPNRRTALESAVGRNGELFLAWFCLLRHYADPRDPRRTRLVYFKIHGPDPLTSIIYPPLPSDIKNEIDKKKIEAEAIITTLNQQKYREINRFRRLNSMLSSSDKTVLEALIKAWENDGIGYLRPEDIKHYLPDYHIQKIIMSLRTLSGHGLVINEGTTWKPTATGIDYINILKERQNSGSNDLLALSG